MSTPRPAISGPRRVYRHADLRRTLDPESVAIVGASTTAGTPGCETLANLADYSGRLYLVNSRYEKIGDRPCHASLSALPEVPDCVIVAVGRERVEDIVLECAKLGVGGVIVFASGYGETGLQENIDKQVRLAEIGRAANMRIIGPNCIGPANHAKIYGTTFTPKFEFSAQGPAPVAVISQSGGMGNALTQWHLMGFNISHTLTPGNSCDVDCADFVAYLAEDPHCKAIALVFEGVSSTERLIEAGEIAMQAGKPLIVFKLGRGERGAAAALSHSGFLAGSDAAYNAAFDRMGAIVVEDFEHMLETAAFFAKAPAPKSTGVAILSVSGGTGVHAADVAEACGISLPTPSAAAKKAMSEFVPDYGSLANPVDVTAGNQGALRLAGCADTLLADADFGAVVIPQLYSIASIAVETTLHERLSAASLKNGKPTIVSWVTGWQHSPAALKIASDAGVSIFRSTRSCFNALAAWHRLDARRRNPLLPATRLAAASAKADSAKLLSAVADRTLTEREAKRVMAAYGIPVVGEHLAASADDAAANATKLGYPVAMKVESPDLPHKTEAGVIRLNLKTEAEVRAAYDAVMINANKVSIPTSKGDSPLANPPHQGSPSATSFTKPRINGVLVQPMIPPGVEIMVGARVDAMFGPIVIVGLGGILVELMKDTVVALAPVSKPEALAMLNKLRGQVALNGLRGMVPVDRDKLADIICRLSELVADHRDAIEEIDVNPLICAADRIVAVDALIVKKA